MTTLHLQNVIYDACIMRLIAADIREALRKNWRSNPVKISDAIRSGQKEVQTDDSPEKLINAIDNYYDELQNLYKYDFPESAAFLEACRALAKAILFTAPVEEDSTWYVLELNWCEGNPENPAWALYKETLAEVQGYDDYGNTEPVIYGYWCDTRDKFALNDKIRAELGYLPAYDVEDMNNTVSKDVPFRPVEWPPLEDVFKEFRKADDEETTTENRQCEKLPFDFD